MLFTGTGNFLAQKHFLEQKDMGRRENADATNQFAKMRFNISLERAKKAELEKLIEERELGEAIDRRQAEELNLRRTTLINIQNANRQMQADAKTIQKKLARRERTHERENVQTSLLSKKQQDAQENFKMNQRKHELHESTQQNRAKNMTQTQNFNTTRTIQLQDEINWLREIRETEAREN